MNRERYYYYVNKGKIHIPNHLLFSLRKELTGYLFSVISAKKDVEKKLFNLIGKILKLFLPLLKT